MTETEKAAPCEVCLRPAGHMNDEKSIGTCARAALEGFYAPGDTRIRTDCYRLGYERERAARIKAEQDRDEANATIAYVRDAITSAVESENAMKARAEKAEQDHAATRVRLAAAEHCAAEMQAAVVRADAAEAELLSMLAAKDRRDLALFCAFELDTAPKVFERLCRIVAAHNVECLDYVTQRNSAWARLIEWKRKFDAEHAGRVSAEASSTLWFKRAESNAKERNELQFAITGGLAHTNGVDTNPAAFAGIAVKTREERDALRAELASLDAEASKGRPSAESVAEKIIRDTHHRECIRVQHDLPSRTVLRATGKRLMSNKYVPIIGHYASHQDTSKPGPEKKSAFMDLIPVREVPTEENLVKWRERAEKCRGDTLCAVQRTPTAALV